MPSLIRRISSACWFKGSCFLPDIYCQEGYSLNNPYLLKCKHKQCLNKIVFIHLKIILLAEFPLLILHCYIGINYILSILIQLPPHASGESVWIGFWVDRTSINSVRRWIFSSFLNSSVKPRHLRDTVRSSFTVIYRFKRYARDELQKSDISKNGI